MRFNSRIEERLEELLSPLLRSRRVQIVTEENPRGVL
jgi:hypothetical protein